MKEYQKYNEEGRFLGKRKHVFNNRYGNPPRSLLCTCLRDGTLDVDLETGEILSLLRKKPHVITCIPDHSGYLRFYLHRERKTLRRKTVDKRWRQTCGVHRAVLMKKFAVNKSPDNWREFVEDIPPTLHVDHVDRNNQNNAASNLRLQGFMENSNDSEPSVGEQKAVENYQDPSYTMGDTFDEFN